MLIDEGGSMSNTLKNLEQAIAEYADYCRTHIFDDPLNELFIKVIEAGVALYKDESCEVYSDAEQGWAEDDRYYLPLFTSLDEVTRDVDTYISVRPASRVFDTADKFDMFDGVVINPYGPNPFTFDDWPLAAVLMIGHGADHFTLVNPETGEEIDII